MRTRRWYSRFGIQPPFPWAPIAVWAGASITAGAALRVIATYLGLSLGVIDVSAQPSTES